MPLHEQCRAPARFSRELLIADEWGIADHGIEGRGHFASDKKKIAQVQVIGRDPLSGRNGGSRAVHALIEFYANNRCGRISRQRAYSFRGGV